MGLFSSIFKGPPISSTMYGAPRGLRRDGTVDLYNRPQVVNEDGSVSTVRSLSFGTDEGEVLVPTVSDDGRIMSDDEAMALYGKTGRSLGVFDTPENATAYAEDLHNQQDRLYGAGAKEMAKGLFTSPTFDQYSQTQQLPQMPVTPQPKGLLASLSGLLAKADNPNDQGLTFWDRLGTVGAGLRDDSGIAQLQAQQNTAKTEGYRKNKLREDALTKANADADALGLTGRERLVFMANPEKWAEENAKRYAPATLGAGDARIIPGEDPMYNARTFTAGDQIFNTTMGGAPAQVGSVAPTFADETARMNATKPDYQAVNPEYNVLQTNPYAGVGGGIGGGTAPQQQGYAPQEGVRSDRNNNAGNLRWDGKSQWQGMKGVDPQGFVIFDSPENGVRAAGINLANQQKLHGLNTLSDVIAKYAPQADNNNTQAYIQSVAQQTGIDPNQPINLSDPAIQAKVLPAMFKVEGGGTPARIPTPPQQDQGFAPQIIQQGRPKDTSEVQLKADRQGQMQLRKEFDGLPDVKNYNTVAGQYQNIRKFAADNSGSNDIGLIFSYMKMLDPTSVVREGEYATAQKTGGIPASVVNQYNKALNGQFLTPAQRQSYVKTAKSVHDNARQRYDEVLGQYRDYGAQSGYDPNFIQSRAAPKEDEQRAANGGLAGATDAQHKRYAKIFKSGTAYGSATNPYLVRSQGEYDALKNGQWFIDDDGALAQKK